MAAFVQQRDQRAVLREVFVLHPHALEGALRVAARVGTALGHRDDGAVHGRGRERPVLRMQLERNAARLAPALQLEDAVALPRRMALRQRQAAGVRKHLAEIDRPVAHGDAVLADEIEKGPMAKERPRGGEGEPVVDGAGHGMNSGME